MQGILLKLVLDLAQQNQCCHAATNIWEQLQLAHRLNKDSLGCCVSHTKDVLQRELNTLLVGDFNTTNSSTFDAQRSLTPEGLQYMCCVSLHVTGCSALQQGFSPHTEGIWCSLVWLVCRCALHVVVQML